MLKFYWPFSTILFFIISLYDSAQAGFLYAGGLELLGIFIILFGIRRSREIRSWSLVGFFLEQYFLGDVIAIEDILTDSGFRILAYMLGYLSFFSYIPCILLLLWSTMNPAINQKA